MNHYPRKATIKNEGGCYNPIFFTGGALKFATDRRGRTFPPVLRERTGSGSNIRMQFGDTRYAQYQRKHCLFQRTFPRSPGHGWGPLYFLLFWHIPLEPEFVMLGTIQTHNLKIWFNHCTLNSEKMLLKIWLVDETKHEDILVHVLNPGNPVRNQGGG